MESYNILIDAPNTEDIDLLCKSINAALLYCDADLVVVNTKLGRLDILSHFPDALELKITHYDGENIQNFLQFSEEFSSPWSMLILPKEPMIIDVVDRYSDFWDGEANEIFLPARNGSLDLSGHLLLMSREMCRNLSPEHDLAENLFLLTHSGAKLKGIQGCSNPKKGGQHERWK